MQIVIICHIIFLVFFYFRNFNKEIFTRRPEFCLLYEKLQKSCKQVKREALTEKYPDLCSTIDEVKESIVICPPREANASVKLAPILFRLNGSLLKLRDELYVYARDNLAVVNIYIKDATVTKIRRDQKVFNLCIDRLDIFKYQIRITDSVFVLQILYFQFEKYKSKQKSVFQNTEFCFENKILYFKIQNFVFFVFFRFEIQNL